MGTFVCFWLYHTACEIIAPPTGIEPRSRAVKVLRPKHWTTRECPIGTFWLFLGSFQLKWLIGFEKKEAKSFPFFFFFRTFSL